MTQRKRIAIASCQAYPDLLEDDRLFIEPLQSHDIACDAHIWNDPAASWEDYDAVVIRSTWDYYLHADAFRHWLKALVAKGIKVLNPVDVILDNIDKRYLIDLEAMGIPTIPTRWVEPQDPRPIAAILHNVPWAELVIKPAISAGAYRTLRCSRAELMANDEGLRTILQGTHALIQPFMPEIVETGEYSFLFFGPVFSHAVLKSPAKGDFRVQWTHGGRQERCEVSPSILAQVMAVMQALPRAEERLFSRIDGIIHDGQFLLVEAELIEPYLFFAQDQEAPRRFARALQQLLT